MNRREIARSFVFALREGKAPWRFPHNRLPHFAPYFDRFFTGEPRSMADSNYSAVDSIIEGVGVKVGHHWNCRRPRYWRDQDRIILPPKMYFQDEAHYQATRLHEICHAIERSDRANWSGPAHQAELVAETSTSMVLSGLQLACDTDNTNQNKWLPWWTMEITWDHGYLFESLAQAEKSASYLLDLHRRQEAA